MWGFYATAMALVAVVVAFMCVPLNELVPAAVDCRYSLSLADGA